MRQNNFSIPYRPELQGIRAIAVFVVLLFHFELLGVRGGYLGVDIFFVLSGYLITSILRKSDKDLEIKDYIYFLVKRFWRIVPALFLVVVLSLVAGWFFLIPSDYERLSYEALSTFLFASNHLFANQVSYFDVSSKLKPLLHTWSLSVELQFYLLWPFLFFGTAFNKRFSLLRRVIFVLLFSLGLDVLLAIKDQDVGFFIMPTRLWEFSFGALAALLHNHRFVLRFKPKATILSSGAIFIMISLVFLAQADAFFQIQYTLPLCLSVFVLIVMSAHSPALKKGLSSRVLTWNGMISYSLYLVHWPIIVFTNYLFFPETPQWISILLLAACFPLAYGLYRFVEDPMRLYGRSQNNKSGFMAVLPLVMVSLFASLFCAYIIVSNGVLNRFNQEALDRIAHPYSLKGYRSIVSNVKKEMPPPDVGEGASGMVLWGDSHAGHFYPGIKGYLAQRGQKTFKFGRLSCLPISGVDMKYSLFNPVRKCSRKFNDAIFNAIVENPEITTVILAARWVIHLERHAFGKERYKPIFLTFEPSDSLSHPQSQKIFKKSLEKMVVRLRQHNKKVIILGQVPEFGFDAARCSILRSANSVSLEPCFISQKEVENRHKAIDHFFSTLAASDMNISYIRTVQDFCSKGRCKPALNNKLAYKDDDHILPSAAKVLIEKYFPLLPDHFWSTTKE